MIRLNNAKLPVDYTDKIIISEISSQLRIPTKAIKSFKLARLSVDARKKHDVHYIANIDVCINENIIKEKVVINKNKKSVVEVKPYNYYIKKVKAPELPPVIVGAGPAGLFCGLILAQSGMCPIIIERGKCVEERQKDVNTFWNTGILNTNSNVQFGEGGAGTFSDGKLNTGTKDVRGRKVLEEFVRFGAPKEILYNAKPHIGTDRLPKAVTGIRNEIISLGGKVLFETQLTDIIIKNEKICGIEINGNEKIECKQLVLALGHSARDTFKMLAEKGIAMEQKPFSVGARIEHLQANINKSQYGEFANKGNLGSADYKLAVHLESGRGVYTFCMCPGGTVVSASSEENRLVTNGMSCFARDGINSNSALLVGVSPSDFGSDDVLAGVEFQRRIEEKAFAVGGGNYKAPVQRVADFMQNKRTTSFGSVLPTYTAGTEMADINECLPEYVTTSMKNGIILMDKKLKGFADGDALLTAPETRSSSPVRILRDEMLESLSVKGLYPCGEGAGYAGGIMSAGVDGIKCAEMILKSVIEF